jgi:hypothetical protein
MSRVSSTTRHAAPPVVVLLCGWLAVTLLPVETATATATAAEAPLSSSSFTAAGSAEQVYAVGLSPDSKASLVCPTGHVVSTLHVLLTDYTGNTETGDLSSNASAWQWDWRQSPAGTAVSYVTAPLATDTTVVGAGAVDLWVRSSTPDVDLQATISEVRPDGNETFLQNGWLRASDRSLSRSTDDILGVASTATDPVPSFTSAAAAPMPAGRFVKVVIPL